MLRQIGSAALGLFGKVGHFTLFCQKAFLALLTPPFYWRQILEQLKRIGYDSLPLIGLTAFFTGAVLALQIYIGGSRFNAESLVASIVAVGITRELGPVLAGLMVAGRVSAAIAAEIGTMRIGQQIDALITLSTDPFKYLVAPRLLAALICVPLLVGIADIIAIFGSYIASTQSLGFSSTTYLIATMKHLHVEDITSGLIKACVFGGIIALMGCYHGFYSRGGARGVGQATTRAVVSSSILILAANYVMTSVFFST